MVIDEVQKAPILLDVVHDLIERRAGPLFVLTGSSARKLKREGVDLRPQGFREDYPEAELRLLYVGEEAFEVDGIHCLPCDDFLRRLVPGQSLP